MRLQAQGQRWYTSGRKWAVRIWLALALGHFAGAFLLLSGGDLTRSAIYFVGAIALSLLALQLFRQRVEALERGLLVCNWRTRVIPWQDIEEIRPDPPGAWGTKLVVVKRDGEVVNLPLQPTQTGPVEFWKAMTADHQT